MALNSSKNQPLALDWLSLIPADKQEKWQNFVKMEASEVEVKELLALNKEAFRRWKQDDCVSVSDLAARLKMDKKRVSKKLFRLKEICRSFLLLQWLKQENQSVTRQRLLSEFLLDQERLDLIQKSKSEIKKNIEALDERIAYQLWPRFELSFMEMQTGTSNNLEEIVPRFTSAMEKLEQAFLYFSYRITLTSASIQRLTGLDFPVEQWRKVNSLIAKNHLQSHLEFVSESEIAFDLLDKEISHTDVDSLLDRMEQNPISDPYLQHEIMGSFAQLLGLAFQKGDKEMGRKELRLRRIMEDRGYHLTRGQISPQLYRKWVSIALALGELEEAKRITKTYATKLNPAFGNRFVDWNLAEIAFAEADYESANSHLQKIGSPGLKFSDVDYAKFSILQSKIFFELGNIQAGLNANKTYRNWINSKQRKLPRASIERYKAWLSVMYQLFRNAMRAKYDQPDYESILKLIEETNPLDKQWLLDSASPRV